MERTAAVSEKPRESTSRARPTLNPWIVVGAILILIVALILLELHIRRSIEGPGHLQQNTQIQDSTGTGGGVYPAPRHSCDRCASERGLSAHFHGGNPRSMASSTRLKAFRLREGR